MSTTSALLEDARGAGARAERARLQMQEAAQRRQRSMLALHERGMSIRAIAEQLEITSGTAQQLIDKAREARKREGLFRRREFRVSYELYVELVRRFRQNPEVLQKAYGRNYAQVHQHLRGDAVEWLDQWGPALSGGPDEFAELALRTDDVGESIRSVSPFAGVLTPVERARAIKRATISAV